MICLVAYVLFVGGVILFVRVVFWFSLVVWVFMLFDALWFAVGDLNDCCFVCLLLVFFLGFRF